MLWLSVVVHGARTACSIAGHINAYPAVRRSGSASNGFKPSQEFEQLVAAVGMPPFVSDVALRWVSIIRTSPPDHSFSAWNTECSFAPTCGVGVSNASLAASYKKEHVEVNDVVSLDIIVEGAAAGFHVPFARGVLTSGAKVFVKIGCATSKCKAWAGVGGANIFRADRWVPNAGTADHPVGYDITAIINASPDASLAEGVAGSNGHHIELTVGAAAAPVDEEGGVVLGAVLATAIGVPRGRQRRHAKIKTFSSAGAYEIADTRCMPGSTASLRGVNSMVFLGSVT